MMTEPELLDLAWSYPLFEALYGRRSRRFGLGFEMPEGPFRYKSARMPVPLSELEEALMVGADSPDWPSGICPRPRCIAAAAAAHSQRHGPAATPRCSSPTTKVSMSLMPTLRRASCARSRRQTSVASSSNYSAHNVARCAVAGSTSRAAYCQ